MTLATALMIGGGALLLGPGIGGAEEEPAEKTAAIAKAPDFTGDLLPGEDPAPAPWTQTGEFGDWGHTAAPAATAAMLTWGRLMALPFDVQERVTAIGNPVAVADRHTRLAARFDLNKGFAARLEAALAFVATDTTYAAYSDYDIADLNVTYASSDDECNSPCQTESAFVAFSGRQSHKMQDGTWKTSDLMQFQVTLRPRSILENPSSPDHWRVESFYIIPLEGEGSAIDPAGVV